MSQILLVDDDKEFTDVASNIIEFLGHDVAIANNLEEAYNCIEFQRDRKSTL